MCDVQELHHSKKGFTLIELLVVVAILGILAAVVVPNVSKFIGTGHEPADRTELHNVVTAMTYMMADAGTDTITSVGDGNDDLNDVYTEDISSTRYYLRDYLESASDMKCGYVFASDGDITQNNCSS